jgi:hypothetical protein
MDAHACGDRTPLLMSLLPDKGVKPDGSVGACCCPVAMKALAYQRQKSIAVSRVCC